MKMYDYLVADNFTAEGYLTASSGTMHVSRKKKLNTFEEINSLRDFIAEQIPGAKNIAIYNFIMLGRHRH